MRPIRITFYAWAGSWGPFSIKIPCGECSVTRDILLDLMSNELEGIPLELKEGEWLSNWWRPLRHGAWHAPIVMVENKVVSEGEVINRGNLCEAVVKEYTARFEIKESVMFGKPNCPYCVRAKQLLDSNGASYTYKNVLKDERALYEVFIRAKKEVGNKTPITMPQIWLNGKYVGGADELGQLLEE